MDSAKTQLADKLKSATNVLVTVSRNPSVDQLAACLGLTLVLNKLNKHAVAVFSGEVPSTLEFLQPEETLEKNTDSLQDFIIALDKSKADKLRYKVEDNVVRIFITPYRTSISQEDLEFSQGDFNVDLIVALGVHQQEDLDEAITSHGRILHDATVASMNTSADGGLGSITWHDPQASSLSELVTELTQLMGKDLFDNQIATALLTGIVAETNRFSNDKTSSQTMSASAALMAAGANQQLVATKLQETGPTPNASNGKPNGGPVTLDNNSPKSDDGTLDINHNDTEPSKSADSANSGALPTTDTVSTQSSPTGPALELPSLQQAPAGDNLSAGSKLVTEPPSLGGMLTANTEAEEPDSAIDPLSLPSTAPAPLLNRPINPPSQVSPPPEPPVSQPTPTTPPNLQPAPPNWVPPAPSPVQITPDRADDTGNHTLAELEESVHSPHVNASGLDTARDEVNKALVDNVDPTPAPIQALNAQPMGGNLHSSTLPIPSALPQPGTPASVNPPMTDSTVTDPTAPPPVPPPIPFQFGGSDNSATPPQPQ